MLTDWRLIDGFERRECRPLRNAQGVVLSRERSLANWWDMHHVLMTRVNEIRHRAQMTTPYPVRVVVMPNGGFALDGHSPESLHGQYMLNVVRDLDEPMIGRALDFTIEEKIKGVWTPWPWDKQALHCWKWLDKSFGLGVYPFWERNRKQSPGIHVDYREDIADRNPAVWVRWKNGIYATTTFKNFHELIREVTVETSMTA